MQIERQVDINYNITFIIHHEFYVAVLAVPLVELLVERLRIHVLLQTHKIEVLDLDKVVRVALLRNDNRNAYDTAVVQLLTHTDDLLLAIIGHVLAVFHILLVEFFLDRFKRAVLEPFVASTEPVKKSHTVRSSIQLPYF